MKKILLVTVTKVETISVLDLFLKQTGSERTGQIIGNNVYYPLGQVGGADIVLVQSDMGAVGPGASVLTISEAITHFSPVAVIMIGIAFGMNPENQKLGDILVSRQLFSYEPQKVKDGGIMYRGNTIPAPSAILKIFHSGENLGWKGPNVQFGMILSGEKLINDRTFRDQLLVEKPEAVGGEMEGAGLYAAATDANVDWILVKGICDFADGFKQDDAQSIAANNAANFVLHVIKLGYWSDGDSSIKTTNDIPQYLIKIAEKEIDKKKNQVTSEARPGFNFGNTCGVTVIGQSPKGTYGIVQNYQNGIITFQVDGPNPGETFATYGSIYFRLQQMAENPVGVIGLPIGDETEAAPSPYLNSNGEFTRGRYSSFENGELVWCANGEYQEQVYVLKDPIRSTYDSIGGSGSYLGFPISDCYEYGKVERCDFEGGTIVNLQKKNKISIIRNLHRITYSDSPFIHGWSQYSGPKSNECFKVRLDARIGFGKNILAFNDPWQDKAVLFPEKKFTDVKERFCGITVKSLNPKAWLRLYLRMKTTADHPQYFELDSHNPDVGLVKDETEGVDYWRIPMPSQSRNPEWYTLIIDLEKTTRGTFGNDFLNLERICLRGHIGIADFFVSDSREAIEAVAINPIFIE